VVPHIIIQSSRLRLGEFETHPAKRVLQHNLPGAEMVLTSKAYTLLTKKADMHHGSSGFRLGA